MCGSRGFLFGIIFYRAIIVKVINSECLLMDGWIWKVRGGLVIVEGGEKCVVVGRIVS